MNTVEDRLTAALHARAELVQHEDLRAPELPYAETSRGLRPWTYAVLAAACAAAIAVPFVVSRDDDGNSDAPPISPGPTPTDLGEGADWRVVDRAEGDVDGDGIAEEVRLRRAGGEYGDGPVRVEVQLSSGPLVWTLALKDPLSTAIVGVIPLGNGADAQVLLWQEPPVLAKGERELTVLDLVDLQFVHVPAVDNAPLDSGFDGRDRKLDWWIDADDTLMSSRSLVEFENNGHDITGPERYEVDVWTWSLQDTGLWATKQPGPWCRDTTKPRQAHPQPGTCVTEEPVAGAIVMPGSLDQIVVGESWQVELDGDGLDTVSLEGPAGREYWEDGEVELVVTLTHSGTHRVPLPASYFLTVRKATIIGPGDGVDLLVGSSGGDLAAYTIYGFWNGEFGEKTLGSEEPLLVSEEGGATSWQFTEISTDGRLVTFQGSPQDGPDIATAWEWSVAVEHPTATELGTYCRQDDEVTWVPCT